MINPEKRLIIFDGMCNLCDYSIQFIIKYDKRGNFRFISGQSELGMELQAKYGVSTIQDGTVILIKDSQVYVKSDAALEIAKELDGAWKHLSVLRFIPKALRDHLYSLVSKNRYRWFGKKEECLIPDQSIRERFL